MNIDRLMQQFNGSATIPAVDQWQPALSGDIDIVIQADSTWLHEGKPFERLAIPRLLASLLRRDADGYCLVTPVERWRVTVVDCPFVAVEADFHDDAWWLTTQFDDVVRVDAEHPLSLSKTPEGVLAPECAVRFGLAARLHRNVYYRLVEQATLSEADDGECQCRLYSAGSWYVLGQFNANDAMPGEVT